MIIMVRGVRYRSADAAARALGVRTNTVYRAVAIGREETLGTSSWKGRGRRGHVVVIDGVGSWSSLVELDRWLGKYDHWSSRKRKRGRWNEVEAEAAARKEC